MAFKDEDIAAEFDRRTAPFRDMNVMRCLSNGVIPARGRNGQRNAENIKREMKNARRRAKYKSKRP